MVAVLLCRDVQAGKHRLGRQARLASGVLWLGGSGAAVSCLGNRRHQPGVVRSGWRQHGVV